jgi:hypothetical protein
MGRKRIIASGLFAAVLAITSGAVAPGCSNDRPAVSHDGLLRLAFAPAGFTINSVHYVVQNSGVPPTTIASGDINVSDPKATASANIILPAGTGETVVLTADTVPPTGNASYCTGQSVVFNVVGGQSVQVFIWLVCGGTKPSPDPGMVDVSATVVAGDHCPALTASMASPSVTAAHGGQIDVSAVGTDADAADTLTFAWAATSGSFASPTSTGSSGATSATTYTCDSAGPQTLMLTVADNHTPTPCSTSLTFTVTCQETAVCESLSVPSDGAGASAPALAAYNPPGDFTIEGWVYPTALGGYQTVAAHWDTRANSTASYALQYDPSGAIFLDTSSTGSDEVLAMGTASVVVNKWNHVAATFSSSTKTVSLFKDGAAAGSTVVAFDHVAPISGVPFTLGVLAMSPADVGVRDPQSVIGYVDEVRLSGNVRYTGAFTPSDTLTPDASTLALFHMDETTGTTVADSSPAGNSATLVGGATHAASCPAGPPSCTQTPPVPNLTSGAWLICNAQAGPLVWTGLMTFTATVPTCTGAMVQGMFHWADQTTYAGETLFTGTYDASTKSIMVDEVQVLSGNVGPGHDFMTYDPATDTMVNGGWTCSNCNPGMWTKAIHVADPTTATCP